MYVCVYKSDIDTYIASVYFIFSLLLFKALQIAIVPSVYAQILSQNILHISFDVFFLVHDVVMYAHII